MGEKLATMTRWWILPSLLTLVIAAADAFLFAIIPRWLFITLMVLSAMLLLLLIVLFFSALILRKWWHALGILVSCFTVILLLNLNLVILTICYGLEREHAPQNQATNPQASVIANKKTTYKRLYYD